MGKKFSQHEWNAYYSKKRIVHQWLQVHLLGTIDCERILEVGPGLGLVTSLLVNVGYQVDTLDKVPRLFDYPDVRHLEKDLCTLRSDEISGYDAIICCETLEHIEWPRVGSILTTFRDSGAKHLIVSVPYMAFQLLFEIYLNSLTARHYFSLKKWLWLRDFAAEPPGGHQWEIGYRGYKLRSWEDRLRSSGWSIMTRDFSEHCRSVFHVLKAV
jgi:hypothetical protein